jgi:hypothetical protein
VTALKTQYNPFARAFKPISKNISPAEQEHLMPQSQDAACDKETALAWPSVDHLQQVASSSGSSTGTNGKT